MERALPPAGLGPPAHRTDRTPPRGPAHGDHRPFRWSGVSDRARTDQARSHRPLASRIVAGDDLLRRACRHDLPAHGPAAEPSPGKLVRPGALLERRPAGAGLAVRLGP